MGQDIQFDPLEAQLRECYGRIVWSHKVQEKCADILSKRLSIIKLSQIILSALTTGSLLITLFGNNNFSTVIAAILSTLLLCLNTYMKDYNLGELAQKHADTAIRLWEIRESYLSVLSDIYSKSITIDQVKSKRDELQDSLSTIYKNAPRTNEKCYKEAQKALNINKEMTFSDDEIDNFLPVPLRRSK